MVHLSHPLIQKYCGKMQMHKFVIGTNKWIILALVSFLVSIVGLVANLTIEVPSHVSVWFITGVSAIIAVFSSVKDWTELRKLSKFYQLDIVNSKGGIARKFKEYEPEKENNFEKSSTFTKLPPEYVGFIVIRYANYYAIYSKLVNKELKNGKFNIKLKKEKFKLHETSKVLASFVLKSFFETSATVFNSKKIRLVTDLTEAIFKSPSNVDIEIQETDYFSTLVTNDIATKTFFDTAHNLVFDGYSNFIETGPDKLRPLVDSENICSNHMGGSTIAFSSDGKMHIVIQGAGNVQSANLLAPSGSGSFDFEDLENKTDFVEMVTSAINRELREECGINDNISINTILIGYARYLNRGGLPQFFGISYVNDTDHNFKKKPTESPYVAKVNGQTMDRTAIEKFQADLASFKEHKENNFSFVLWLNIKFLEDFLCQNPVEFIDFLHGKP